MRTTRVIAVMLDGTKHEATGVYMALADRVAFEQKYGFSLMVEALGDDGTKVELKNEEQLAFFPWRVLDRAGCPVGTFEEFLEKVEEMLLPDFEEGAGDAAPAAPLEAEGGTDPTDAAPLSGSSPS